jgi:putative addiction module component (TIGR02574 family)
MRRRFDEIAKDALSLPIRERVRLAQRLVRSIDGADESEEDVEQLWQAVAERRQEELRSGKVQAVDATVVFAKARRALRK